MSTRKLTDAQKRRKIEWQRVSRANRTPEQKRRDSERYRQRWASLTPRQKQQKAAALRTRYALLSAPERQLWCKAQRVWREDQTPEQKHAARRRKAVTQKRRADRLSDEYVKGLLARASHLKRSQIPLDLVEAKRLQIKIQRYLKEAQE